MQKVLLSIGTAMLFGFAASGAPVELSAGRAAGEIPLFLATGSSNSIYVAGVEKGAGGSGRIYVARIDAASNKRESTAYLGGSGSDAVKAIAVDRAGNAYIVGHTSSPDFPVFGAEPTKRAGGTDVFLAKIDAKGNWLYSTLLGGAANESAHAVAVDAAGDVYVTGWTASTDFPADGAKSGAVAAFLARFRAGAKLSATLIGQAERTIGNAIAVDRDGAIYIAGTEELRARSDAFLLKLTNRGDLVFRSTISANGDHAATSLALAPDGSAWIAGWTNAGDSPLRHSGDSGGARDAFAARFDAEGTRTFSKVTGGASDDEAHDISVDALGNLYLAGITRSPDFPAPLAESSAPHSFAIKWSAEGDRVFLAEPVAPVQSSSLVRMAVDPFGNAILTTNSGDGGTLHLLATCHYRLSKAAQSLEAGGGDGAVLVDAPAECPWTAQSNASWLAATRSGDRMEFRAFPNDTGVPRVGSIEAGGQHLTLVQPSKGGRIRQAFTGAIRNNAGFKTTPVTACDDCSASIAPIGFSINFFGTTYTQIYVNNNGNVTFGSSNSSFTPNPISAIQRVLIAPFWADVDTRGTGSSRTTYGQDVVNGRTAFGVNWVDVGYYSSKTNKLNSMQLVLIDRGDLGAGFFDIELNYSGIQWETGDASGGSNGLGGSSARAGFSNGTGAAGTYFELPGSGVNGALLDGGANSLSANSTNSGVAGRYVYNVRAGSIVCGTGITTTTASLPIAGGPVSVNVTSSNAACTWNVTGLPSWITVTTPAGGNGTGTATVTMQVAANSGAPRSATIVIAGQSYTVSQAGSQAPTTCPPYSFLRGADVSMMSGNLTQGSLAGLERLLNGSLTLHNFTGNTTNFTQSSTPQYEQAFSNCIGRPPTTPTPPQGYALLSEKRGISATNPIITNLTGTGTSSSVGVAPYSKDAAKLQVYNANTNKTPGTNATYDIPANPQKLLSGDLNGDARQDIVLISQGVTGGTQGVLTSFPGNANGTLGTRRDVNVGNNPQSATLFDFNGDTRLDAAVANTGSNNVMILNGNGDASFQSPVTLTGDAPGSRAIAAADLNKDGRGDLIIGHNNGVDIRLGNGNGSFQAPIRVASGFTATTVASGDFNKDGNPDIAVSAQSSATAMILLGNGNGTFGPPNSYVTRANAGQFFVSDFDWDGNPDLVFGAGHPDGIVAASNDSSVTVLYGRGNGTLHSSPAAVLPSLGEFTAGDFNSDNLPDVAATAPFVNGQVNTAGLYLFLNNGTGALIPQSPIPIPSQAAPAQLFLITSDDFNGDGRRDIAVTTGSTVRVATGTGFGGFNAPVTFTAGSQLTSIQAADVNGDSRPDLLFTDDGEDRVSVALGNGNGTFQGRSLMNAGVDPKGVAAADVNGDGRTDLIVVNLGQAGNDAVPGGISVLLGSGNGAFQQPSNFPSGLHPTHVTVGDVNLDGRPDIITSTGGANATTFVAIHLGNGNGTFQNPSLLPVALGPAQTALTDFNADGKADILVGHCCGEIQLGLLLGNGNGTFQTEAGIPNSGNGSSYVRALDMNRDAKPDIVFGANGTSGAYVALLLNTNTVTAPVCSFGVSQTSYQAGTQAQTLTGTITSSASTCSFNAQSSASWLSITPTFGQGQSITAFSIAVQSNAGAQRSGTVSIGGQVITVTQSAPACPFNLSPLTLSPPPAGGNYNITVTNSTGCPWSITGVPNWVTIVSPANLSSAGTGTISLNVAVNPGVARIANLVIAGQNFAITQAGTGPAGGLRFTAVEPCRLLETRAEYNFENRSGVFGPPFFNAGDTRSLPLPASTVCRNIPANAKAYVLNVTVVPNGALDFVTVFPTGETRPDFWTVRSPDGLIVANSAIVAAGTGGAISVYASNRTDIIVDISGYFTDNPLTSNLVYYPLTPCRVIETRIDYRSPPGPFGPPTMASRETRPFRFPNNGVCPVPTGAAAYAATITVVPPGPLAFLTAWPEGQSIPNVSSMNSPGGRVLANSVIVPASPDGGINLFTFDRSDVIVDITGYFGPDDGVNGLFYFPVRQCRVSQTNGTGFTGVFNGPIFENETTRTIPIPGSTCAGIPATAKAYSLNATVMPGGSPMPFLTISPSGQPRPNASVINAFEGQTVSSGFLVSAGTNGAVDIFAYRRTHVALEISGYFGR